MLYVILVLIFNVLEFMDMLSRPTDWENVCVCVCMCFNESDIFVLCEINF